MLSGPCSLLMVREELILTGEMGPALGVRILTFHSFPVGTISTGVAFVSASVGYLPVAENGVGSTILKSAGKLKRGVICGCRTHTERHSQTAARLGRIMRLLAPLRFCCSTLRRTQAPEATTTLLSLALSQWNTRQTEL